MDDFLGSHWLAERYQITTCQPLQVISLIDSGRQDVEINGVINQAFPPAYRIEPTLDAHLTFAFKREPFIWSFSLDYFKSSLPLTSSTGSPPSPPASTPARPAFSTNG